MAKLPNEIITEIEHRGYQLGCTTTFERIYKHFENDIRSVFGKDEILDEISQVIDEFIAYENLKEVLGDKE